MNRIGDFAFVIGMLFLITAFGTLDYRGITAAIEAGGSGHHALLVTVGILLFVGACGKSAQIPLYVWLPDAMAGPTPVSALIHAATMVTAGVYMVVRMSALYTDAPEAMGVIAAVGAATAIFAATMGITATDIKKVLAYSTVSQLGYMFAAAGVGASDRRDLPSHDARVLQGAALPRRGKRDPRPGRRAGHHARWVGCAPRCRSRSGRS